MKKIFILIALLVMTIGAMAQSQYFYEWKNGKYVQRSVSEVDSITFSLPETPQNEYKYVDLGLPSGTLWADRNVGAESPEASGDYFAWGETAPKEAYNWRTYKFCQGSSSTLTKYCTHSNFGTVDNKTALDLEDDAAYVNMGAEWRMPTEDEQQELIDKCDWSWSTQNGTKGYKVTGPNGNSIFLPAAGYRLANDLFGVDDYLSGVGTIGRCWSSSIKWGFSYDAWSFLLTPSLHVTDGQDRCSGYPVRAVFVMTKEPATEANKVDLGLPSGTLWADRNVGADSPEDYGDYFAWGETTTKDTYNWSTYKWCEGDSYPQIKYCTNSSYGTVDNKTTLDFEDDAAYVNMGEEWRTPTDAEQIELRDKCTWTWTTLNGVNGYKVTGPNGNYIFFPAAGWRTNSKLYAVGTYGHYGSSSLYESHPYNAWNLDFNSDVRTMSNYGRYFGLSIRAVVR